MMKYSKNVRSDTSITSMQYHSYTPYTTSYNYQDEIRIGIQSQNSYILPSESYLYLEGASVRSTLAANVALQNPNIITNFLPFLFDSMRYELNGVEIDKCKNVGITNTMKGLSSLTKSDVRGLHSAAMSGEDLEAANSAFSFQLPLKLLMGFFEDHTSIVMNAKHELILNRSRNDVNCFHGANDIFTIRIDKIMWRMPHIKVDDYLQVKMLKQIESNHPIPLTYRSWDLFEYPALPETTRHVWSVKTTSHLCRPRYVILGFQTNRNNRINTNAAHFDPIALSDVRMYLNSDSYPQESLQLNFGEFKGAIAYNMYTKFKETYYHDGSRIPSNPMLSYNEWLVRPLFVFDCSRQNEAIKTSSVDVKIEFETRANVPAATAAYCLIIHDNLVEYNPLTNIVTKNL